MTDAMAQAGDMPPPDRRASFRRMPDWLGTLYVAATMLILSYSALFNVIPILIYLGIWLPHMFYRRVFILKPSWDLCVCMLLPVLACYSAFWSDYPEKSIRTGLEAGSMIICTFIMARTVTADALIKGLTAGAVVALLLTLHNGTYNQDYFSGTYSLVGLFGSKNEVGFTAQISVFFSLVLLATKRPWFEKVFFGVCCFGVSAYCLYLSRASSALVSLIVMTGVTGGAWMLTRLPRQARFLGIGLGLLVIITLTLFLMASDAGLEGKLLGSLGKDTTLTGRTYLWSEGIKIGEERPLLGHGYSAFWVVGQRQAERYWHEFGIDSKTGFHFHNTYVQTFVDFGAVGLLLACALVVLTCCKSFGAVLRDGMRGGKYFRAVHGGDVFGAVVCGGRLAWPLWHRRVVVLCNPAGRARFSLIVKITAGSASGMTRPVQERIRNRLALLDRRSCPAMAERHAGRQLYVR